MEEFNQLSTYDLGQLLIEDLFTYYKKCIILNYKNDYDLEYHIEEIEYEIMNRL